MFVQKAPAATLTVLTQALRETFSRPDHPIRNIGTRHGEKLYESLLSREEFAAAEDLGEYYRVRPDARDLNYTKFYEEGEQKISMSHDYTSHNTEQLDVPKMRELLLRLTLIQRAMRGDAAEYEM